MSASQVPGPVPEPEDETQPPAAVNPDPPAVKAPGDNGPSAEAIAAAFARLAPALLAPTNAALAELRADNAALRAELASVRDTQSTVAAAAEPEPEVYYVPHYATQNPHPARKATDSLKPHLLDFRGDKYNDIFATDKGAHFYEYGTLQSGCSFLKDVLFHLLLILPRLIVRLESTATQEVDGVDVSGADDADHLASVYSSLEAIYTGIFNKRVQFLQLRCMLTPDGGKIPDDKKGLLAVFTNMLYGALGEALPENLDQTFKKAIADWEKATAANLIKESGRATAKSRATPAGATQQAAPRARSQPKSQFSKKKK